MLAIDKHYRLMWIIEVSGRDRNLINLLRRPEYQSSLSRVKGAEHLPTFARIEVAQTMSPVNVLHIGVENNRAKFTDPLRFHVRYECLQDLQDGTCAPQ